MRTAIFSALLAGLLTCMQAGGNAAPTPARRQHERAAAPRAAEQEHVAISKAPATVERKGPAPDDGQWHFAGEPIKQSSFRPMLVTPPSRPAIAPRPIQPPAPPKPILPAATHEPLTQNESAKTAGVSLPVRPPAVVAHRGPSFNDAPHRGPNPAIIVGVRPNAKTADTGVLNGTAFHRKP